MNFRPISFASREIIESYILPSSYYNCDFSFCNMMSWRFLYKSEYAIIDDSLVFKFYIEHDRMAFMMPISKGNVKDVICKLLGYVEKNYIPLVLIGCNDKFVTDIESLFANGIKVIPERDFFDYIYLRENLATLRGKHYQQKRNHINKFFSLYPNYELRPLTPDLVEQCLQIDSLWFKNNSEHLNEDTINERTAMSFALANIDKLNILGLTLWVDNKMIAFTYGSPINHNTFDVHVEKADSNYEGAYTMINKSFVNIIPEQYTYINREEDLGLPGLRDSKLSYRPYELLRKTTIILTNQVC